MPQLDEGVVPGQWETEDLIDQWTDAGQKSGRFWAIRLEPHGSALPFS